MTAVKHTIALLFPVAVLFACGGAREESNSTVVPVQSPAVIVKNSFTLKMEAAVKNAVFAELQQGGYKLLGLAIDSVSWDLVSMQTFYGEQKKHMDLDEKNEQKVFSKMQADGLLTNAQRAADSLKRIAASKKIGMLYAAADTVKNIYRVSYKLNASTNAANYNGMHSKYLDGKTLSPVQASY